MRIKCVVTISLSFVTGLSLYQDEAAARPADRVVQLIVREAPDDPLSPITQTVSLGLMKSYTDGVYIEWYPVSATINDLDEFGNVVGIWRGTELFFDTPNGAWAINHFDPLAPADTEFALPPLLRGTATSADSTLVPWVFEILGDLYIPLISDAGTDETMVLNAEAPPSEEPDPGEPAPAPAPGPNELPEDDDPDGQPASS